MLIMRVGFFVGLISFFFDCCQSGDKNSRQPCANGFCAAPTFLLFCNRSRILHPGYSGDIRLPCRMDGLLHYMVLGQSL